VYPLMRLLCEDKIRFTEGPSGHPPRILVISRLDDGLQPEKDTTWRGKR